MTAILDRSYWPADTSHPLLDTTVGDVLRGAAAAHPDVTALVEGVGGGQPRRWTYASLLAEAERVAAALLARFEPGERVGVWAPNIPEWVALEYGAALAGVVLVTVNPAYRPDELAYVLRQSGAAGIVMVPSFRSPMLDYLDSVRTELPGLREVVLFTEWAEFLSSGSTTQGLPDVAPSDAAQIQYTSGTTGFPKGALLHHHGITNNARLFSERYGLSRGDVFVTPMPLFHTAGCVMGVLGCAQRGATLVSLSFDPGLALELAERERATDLLGVPTMLLAMLEHPDLATRDLTSLKRMASGGTPVPPNLARRIEERLGVTFTIVFGTTECSPLLTMTSATDSESDRYESLGTPLPQTEVKIADPTDGEPVAPGQVGELCARGYLVMTGYWNMPAETAAAIDAQGWYHTGDLASMDERGYLRIEGRLKDMIIRGGENIYPREIESLLSTHPSVGDVAVIGLPDAHWGEIVAAVIRPAAGATPSSDELAAFCRQHLAAYKAPRVWHFVEQLPLTASGKIQKFVLREQLSREEATPS